MTQSVKKQDIKFNLSGIGLDLAWLIGMTTKGMDNKKCIDCKGKQ